MSFHFTYVGLLPTILCKTVFEIVFNIRMDNLFKFCVCVTQSLKTNICDEGVCSTETSYNTLIPAPCFPNADGAASTVKHTILNFELWQWTPSIVCMPVNPPYSHLASQRMGRTAWFG